MIDPHSFTEGHIKEVRENSKRDPGLIERTVFALGLLEATSRSGLPFIFKGGSSLLLLLEKPRRFSTDIDIMVSPGTNIEHYLNAATEIWPFVKMAEQVREASSNIEKRHFKFSYQSPLFHREQQILLDVLFEDSPFKTIVRKEIRSELLVTSMPGISVEIPSKNCLLADKLTAFAPHTTGIQFNHDKELEIIKQFFDISVLAGQLDDFAEVRSVFPEIAETELSYRSLDLSPDDVLCDTIKSAACIASRGLIDKDDYAHYKRGIAGIANHVFGGAFSGEIAVEHACVVMYLAAAMLTRQERLPDLKPAAEYMSSPVPAGDFQKLGFIRKTSLSAYGYLIEALRMLGK